MRCVSVYTKIQSWAGSLEMRWIDNGCVTADDKNKLDLVHL